MDETDDVLIARYRAGDESAFEELVRRYAQPVYHYALHYAKSVFGAEDIAQETFVKAWRNFARFDEARNFRAWLFTIAKHAALDYLKKKSPVAFSDIERENGDDGFLSALSDAAPLPDAVAMGRERAARLAENIGALGGKQQRVVRLRHDEGKTFAEIAFAMRAPLNTVKSWYRRAIRGLRRVVAPE